MSNIDGTTSGTVFKLAHLGEAYQYSIIYRFCAQFDCADGRFPLTGLAMDASGNLYGHMPAGIPTTMRVSCSRLNLPNTCFINFAPK